VCIVLFPAGQKGAIALEGRRNVVAKLAFVPLTGKASDAVLCPRHCHIWRVLMRNSANSTTLGEETNLIETSKGELIRDRSRCVAGKVALMTPEFL
jgi:hypothetical protein